MKDELMRVLEALTAPEKHELAELGIPAQRLTDWKKGRRLPTSAQLLTLATVAHIDPAPLLLWHAQQEATPAQLDLFLKALARATACVLVVMLSGGQTDANAATMRASGSSDTHDRTEHYARLQPG